MELVTYYDLELHQMDIKTMFIWINQWGSLKKERNTWCVNLRNQYMNLNRLPGNCILSSIILLRLMDLRKTLFINVYI